MSYVPVKIEDATAGQRLKYARTMLNLDNIDEAASDEQVISAIRSAQPNSPNIFVEEEAPEAVEHREQSVTSQNPIGMQFIDRDGDGQAAVGSLGRGDPRVIIRIRKVDQADGMGNADVPVGVNGVIWQLQRDEDLDVPWRVVEALGLTDQDIVRHTEEGDVQISTARRIVAEFPYGMPPFEEIKAWREKVDNKFCP